MDLAEIPLGSLCLFTNGIIKKKSNGFIYISFDRIEQVMPVLGQQPKYGKDITQED